MFLSKNFRANFFILFTLLFVFALLPTTVVAEVNIVDEGQFFTDSQTVYTKTVSLRVEGYDSPILPQQLVTVQTSGSQPSALDVLEQGLQGVAHVETIGAYLDSIDWVGNGHFGGPYGWDGWNYLVNGYYSTEYGPGDWLVEDGDEVYFYYGAEKDFYQGWIDFEDLTLIPIISVQPATPQTAHDLEVVVTSKYDVYDFNFNLVSQDVVSAIEDAQVEFNNQVYTTDSNGIALIPASAVLAGAHTIKVSKETSTYPRLVRMEKNITIQ